MKPISPNFLKVGRKSLVLSVLVCVAVFGFSAVRALSGAVGVSDPIRISVLGEDVLGKDCLLDVARRTRAGGVEELTDFVDGKTGRELNSDGWSSALTVSSASRDCALKSFRVSVGGREWSFDESSVESLASDDGFGRRIYVVDAAKLGRTPSRIGYFGGLLNWPGDFQALLRIFVKAGRFAAISFLASLFSLAWLSGLIRKFGDEDSDEKVSLSRGMLLCLFGVFLSILSGAVFFRLYGTAFEWPAMDMAPFWMRFYDPNFALNSFFTDVSMLPSPRWVFGYFVIGVAGLLGTDWYHVVFALRVAFTFFVPLAILMALTSVLRRKIVDEGKLTVATAVLSGLVALTLWWKVNSAFALALWSPVVLSAQPETLSLFLSFFGMWVFLKRKRELTRLVAAAIFLFFATLIHPVRSLCVFAFFVLGDHDLRLWREYLTIFAAGFVVPSVVLLASFPVANPLTAEQFVYHYIKQNHDFHYLPSNFGAVNGIPWFVALGLVVVPLLGAFAVGVARKNRGLMWTSILFVVSYCAGVAAEYLFVEIMPIKLFATITPVRFTSMGYWMVAVAASWAVSEYSGAGIRVALPERLLRMKGRLCLGVIAGLVALCIWSAVSLVDDPWSKYRNADPSWAEWLASSTSPGDVFGSSILSVANQLPLIYDRASFLGNGFPFREDDFIEYDARKDALFGSYGEWERLDPSERPPYWSWSKDQFRRLSPEDFLMVAQRFRLDYVIVEKEYASAFADVPVEFENDTFKVYKVRNFR